MEKQDEHIKVHNRHIVRTLKGITTNSDVLISIIVTAFEKEGLDCEQMEIKEGEVQALGGVLLGDGGIGIGGGRGKITKKTWNPFLAKLSLMHTASRARICIKELVKYMAPVGDKSYETRDIRIEAVIEHVLEHSVVGYLVGLAVFVILYLCEGGVMGSLLGAIIIYWPIKAVMKFLGLIAFRSIHPKLSYKVNEVIQSFNVQELNNLK